jgi:2-methylcitrate dehydratase
MDNTTAKLVDYAMSVSYAELSPEVVRACKTRVIDTLGCAIGAYHASLPTMARDLAYRYTGTPAASVLGSGRQSSAEMAAFANGVMLRFLDLSDSYRVKSGGHPSDVLAAIFAVAEVAHADGRSVIAAIAVAYEVYCGFCAAIDINSKGWDQPVYGVLASTLACGKLLGLSRERMGHAVALAVTPNMALHQARRGELSHWKGCAAANGSRNAVFAALLARDGFTGPPAIFEGKAGLWDIVGQFDWPDLGGAPRRICGTHIKCFPVNYHGQSAVWAALDLRPRVRVDEIAAIRVEGYHSSVEEMASDPAHWSPQSHETADHSMPYAVATALLDGEITPASFSEAKLKDPRAARLMRLTTVAESPELSAQFPASAPCRISITLADGATVESFVRAPKGHASNPLADAELENKFLTLARDYCDEAVSRAILNALAEFEHVKDIGEVLRLFANEREIARITNNR